MDVLGLVIDGHDFGDRGLHAEGHFVLRDASLGLGVGELGKGLVIELLEGVEGSAS